MRRLLALGATIGYRFVVADQGKRLLRQSFALYLAPAVIEKMLASNKPPALGGEMRNVTVYFSDIADFSSFAEKIPPAELVAAMNEYLSAMTDIIEAHGGFVDKYIGDAIVAVFGAPLDDPDHATQRGARRAAMRRDGSASSTAHSGVPAAAAAPAHRPQFRRGAGRQYRLAAALQLHGDGRHGEPRLAARRRQQVVRHHDHRVGGDGGADRQDAFAWRELDAIRVKGRGQAVKIYEPLGAAGEVPPDAALRASYAEAWRYRARDFAGAAAFRAPRPDPPSARFLERARRLAQNPPGPDWEPVNALEESSVKVVQTATLGLSPLWERLGGGSRLGANPYAHFVALRGRRRPGTTAAPRKSSLRVPFSVLILMDRPGLG